METYDGMDGLKTGYIYASGFNLAASAVRDGTRLIGVVFGGKSINSRNQIMAGYLDRGFVSARSAQVADNNATYPAHRQVVEQSDADSSYSFTDNIVAQINSTQTSEQGDADIAEDQPAEKTAKASGGWMVQLGAFEHIEDGAKAILAAKNKNQNLNDAIDDLVAVNTKHGVLYRARISGLDHASAREACSAIKSNCLVLAEK